MKYLKTYEQSVDKEPKTGDYVLTLIPKMKIYRWNKVDENKLFLGEIIDTRKSDDVKLYKVLYYDNSVFWTKTWWITRNEIKDFSENINNLEYVNDLEKYNL